MKKIFIYLGIIFLTVYLAVIYRSQILAGFAAAEILIPLPSFFLAVWMTRKVTVSISAETSAVERGEKISLLLHVRNPAPFPLLKGEAEIVYWNQFRQQKSYVKVPMQAAAGSQGEIICQWDSSRCGNLFFQIKRIWIWDFFCLFCFQKKCSASGMVSVLPVPFVMELPEEDFHVPAESEGEKYDPHQPGNDPSETFQIREYRQGDRVLAIHWKMTARTEELMVKEYSRPLPEGGVLFLDLYSEAADGRWMNPDPYLDLVFSLCLAFLEEKRSCWAVWKEEERLEKMDLDSHEAVYELLGRLYRQVPYNSRYDLEEAGKELFLQEKPAFQYRLDLSCRLWEGGRILWEKGRTVPSI